MMKKRGRAAVSLPPLPIDFREALADYLKVKPPPKGEKAKPKRSHRLARKSRR